MLSAETGLGKTLLGFAWGFAMAGAESFCHWQAGPKTRVLYIDGEMSAELVQARLADEAARTGQRPENFHRLCREDRPDMPPLDTEEGQAWLDQYMDRIGGVDFLILDNVMSLTTGDLKDEEAWKPVTDWMRDLTRRRIGVLWINHTGHDASRAYGTKTREWQLDTVMIAETVAPVADETVAFRLTFTKARQRRPENLDDFESVILRLKDDRWMHEGAPPRPGKKENQDSNALRLLREAIDEVGEPVPGKPHNIRGVKILLWRSYCNTRHLSDSDNPDSQRQAFKRAMSGLHTSRCMLVRELFNPYVKSRFS